MRITSAHGHGTTAPICNTAATHGTDAVMTCSTHYSGFLNPVTSVEPCRAFQIHGQLLGPPAECWHEHKTHMKQDSPCTSSLAIHARQAVLVEVALVFQLQGAEQRVVVRVEAPVAQVDPADEGQHPPRPSRVLQGGRAQGGMSQRECSSLCWERQHQGVVSRQSIVECCAVQQQQLVRHSATFGAASDRGARGLGALWVGHGGGWKQHGPRQMAGTLSGPRPSPPHGWVACETRAHRGVPRLPPGLLRLAALCLGPCGLRGLRRAALRVNLRHRCIGIRRVQAHHFLQRRMQK
jgi:hypothetical protein